VKISEMGESLVPLIIGRHIFGGGGSSHDTQLLLRSFVYII
jgi:hypothetical protein